MAKKIKQGSRGKAKKSKGTSSKRSEPKSGKVSIINAVCWGVMRLLHVCICHKLSIKDTNEMLIAGWDILSCTSSWEGSTTQNFEVYDWGGVTRNGGSRKAICGRMGCWRMTCQRWISVLNTLNLMAIASFGHWEISYLWVHHGIPLITFETTSDSELTFLIQVLTPILVPDCPKMQILISAYW